MFFLNVGQCCNIIRIFKKKFNILNQGKERAAKTKLLSAKLRAESHCAELDSMQCDTILDLR